MNVLVVGCGRMGTQLATMLDRHGHDVSVIDEVADHFNSLGEEFTGLTVNGMPMDMDVLRSAGVEGCDAVAVVTPDDNLNITVSQIVREFFGVQNVVTRISDPAREKVFKQFGLKSVCQTKLGCSAMYAALTAPEDERQITFGTSTIGFVLREVEPALVGTPLLELPLHVGSVISGVLHSCGTVTLFDGRENQVLGEGDKLIISYLSD